MRKLAVIIVLILVVGMAAFLISFTDRSPTVESARVMTIPGRGRCVEIEIRNNTGRPANYFLYRQQLFNGRWVPEVSPYTKCDESGNVAARGQCVVTFRIHESGGSFRFQIHYSRPPHLHRRFLALLQKNLGRRPEPL